MQQALRYTRGIIYYLFFRLQFFPKLVVAKITGKEKIVPITIDGAPFKLAVAPGEGGFAEDIFLMRIREYPQVHYFKAYLAKHQKTIDAYVGIGSNVGYYAVLAHKWFAKLSNKRRRFFFVEPVRVTFARLLKNLRLNGIPQAHAYNVALGDKDGTVEMVVPKAKNLSHIRSISAHYPGDTLQRVPMMKLSTFATKRGLPKKNILFRWDIEGYEYNVVRGNVEFFRTLANAYIIMELHAYYMGPEKTIELFTLLSQCGFRVDQVVSCEPLYFLKMPPFIRRFLIWNFLKEHKGEALGRIGRYRSWDSLIKDIADRRHALYSYPNLHLFLSKTTPRNLIK